MPTELIIAIALVVTGGALVTAGAVRLAGVALRDMPRGVAFGAIALGVGVAAFATALSPEAATDLSGPSMTLEPLASPDAPPDVSDAEEEARGSIGGVVRTHEGEPVPDAPVILQRFERTEPADRIETTTAEDGRFSFEDLPASPLIAYTVQTEFDGTPFDSGLIFLDPQGGDEEIEIVVAEATEDASVVTIHLSSMVLVGDAEAVQVVQVLRLTNGSDLALTDGLRLPLLPGAAGIEVRQGLDRTRLAFDAGDLISIAPVLPGTHEIVYTYGAPMPRGGLDASGWVHYPTERLEILLSGDLVGLDAPGFQPEGTVELGTAGDERTYRRYSASDLERGAQIVATVHLDGGGPWRFVLVATGIAAAVFIIGFPLLRRRRGSTSEVETRAEPVTVSEDR